MTTNELVCASDYSAYDPCVYQQRDTQLNSRVPHPLRDGLVRASSPDSRRPSYDMNRRDFIGKNFADECMVGTFVIGTHFYDVTFLRCNLTSSQFYEAQFVNVRFWDCILDGADFLHAELTDVCVEGSSLIGTDLNRATLTRVCYGHSHLSRR